MVRKLRLVFPLVLLAGALRLPAQMAGIPINDDVVIAKCGACHTQDTASGTMARLSEILNAATLRSEKFVDLKKDLTTRVVTLDPTR